MEKHSGLNQILFATRLVGFTLILTFTVGVLGAFADATDDFQAPRGFHLSVSFHESDPLQAPRGQDMQMPRSESAVVASASQQ